ncbi:MAG: hypothetical protein L3K03_00915 [Thermoplasmata archaeon]|nr:hypothetical protein [Thermoplasmata archaeon]
MSEFRGSDEVLDREIDTLETIARHRLRRAAKELRELDREIAALRRERRRRRSGDIALDAPVTVGAAAEP